MPRVPQALRGWRTRARSLRQRLLLPEASAGAEQWQRVVLRRAVDEHLASLGRPEDLSVAEISGDDYADRGWRRFDALDYPAFDLCAPLPDGHPRYDVVLCQQVLEHVVDPTAAAANLKRLTQPGGHVVVSTPFLIRMHDLPEYGMPDHWRWTPSGLRLQLERAGLRVDATGSWGNRDAIVGNLDRWPRHRPWMPLRDEPRLAVQVWAFAGRPEQDGADEEDERPSSPPTPG